VTIDSSPYRGDALTVNGDSDPDNDPLTVTDDIPASLTLSDSSTPTYSYTLSDGHDHSVSAAVNFSVYRAPGAKISISDASVYEWEAELIDSNGPSSAVARHRHAVFTVENNGNNDAKLTYWVEDGTAKSMTAGQSDGKYDYIRPYDLGATTATFEIGQGAGSGIHLITVEIKDDFGYLGYEGGANGYENFTLKLAFLDDGTSGDIDVFQGGDNAGEGRIYDENISVSESYTLLGFVGEDVESRQQASGIVGLGKVELVVPEEVTIDAENELFVLVDWGDGATSTGSLLQIGGSGSRQFYVTAEAHQYGRDGVYVVVAQIADREREAITFLATAAYVLEPAARPGINPQQLHELVVSSNGGSIGSTVDVDFENKDYTVSSAGGTQQFTFTHEETGLNILGLQGQAISVNEAGTYTLTNLSGEGSWSLAGVYDVTQAELSFDVDKSSVVGRHTASIQRQETYYARNFNFTRNDQETYTRIDDKRTTHAEGGSQQTVTILETRSRNVNETGQNASSRVRFVEIGGPMPGQADHFVHQLDELGMTGSYTLSGTDTINKSIDEVGAVTGAIDRAVLETGDWSLTQSGGSGDRVYTQDSSGTRYRTGTESTGPSTLGRNDWTTLTSEYTRTETNLEDSDYLVVREGFSDTTTGLLESNDRQGGGFSSQQRSFVTTGYAETQTNAYAGGVRTVFTEALNKNDTTQDMSGDHDAYGSVETILDSESKLTRTETDSGITGFEQYHEESITAAGNRNIRTVYGDDYELYQRGAGTEYFQSYDVVFLDRTTNVDLATGQTRTVTRDGTRTESVAADEIGFGFGIVHRHETTYSEETATYDESIGGLSVTGTDTIDGSSEQVRTRYDLTGAFFLVGTEETESTVRRNSLKVAGGVTETVSSTDTALVTRLLDHDGNEFIGLTYGLDTVYETVTHQSLVTNQTSTVSQSQVEISSTTLTFEQRTSQGSFLSIEEAEVTRSNYVLTDNQTSHATTSAYETGNRQSTITGLSGAMYHGTTTETHSSDTTVTTTQLESNQSFSASAVETRNDVVTGSRNGNSVSGVYTLTETVTSPTMFSTRRTTNQTSTVTEIGTQTEVSLTRTAVGNDRRGESSLVETSSSDSARTVTETNGATLSRTATETGASSSTRTVLSNSISQRSTTTEIHDNGSTTDSYSVNQASTVSVHETSVGRGSSTATADEIGGSFDNRSTDDVTRTAVSLETNDDEASEEATFVTTTETTQQVNFAHRAGNSVSGGYSLTTTAYEIPVGGVSAVTSRSATANPGLVRSESQTRFAFTTATENGNAVTGAVTLHSEGESQFTGHETVTHLATDSSTNRTGTETNTLDRTANSITGAVTLETAETHSTTTVRSVETRLSVTTSALEANYQDRTVERNGNTILGDFTLTETGAGTGWSYSVARNQTSLEQNWRNTTADSTATVTGNEIVGTSERNETVTTTASSTAISANQSARSTRVEDSTETRTAVGTSDSIGGVFHTEETVDRLATVVSRSSNQTQLSRVTETVDETATRTIDGNSILGTETVDGESHTGVTFAGGDRNQSNSVGYTGTNSSDSYSYRTANSISGVFSLTETVTVAGSRSSDSRNLTSTGDSEEDSAGDTTRTTTGNDLLGTSSVVYEDAHSERTVTSQERNQSARATSTLTETSDSYATNSRNAYSGAVESTKTVTTTSTSNSTSTNSGRSEFGGETVTAWSTSGEAGNEYSGAITQSTVSSHSSGDSHQTVYHGPSTVSGSAHTSTSAYESWTGNAVTGGFTIVLSTVSENSTGDETTSNQGSVQNTARWSNSTTTATGTENRVTGSQGLSQTIDADSTTDTTSTNQGLTVSTYSVSTSLSTVTPVGTASNKVTGQANTFEDGFATETSTVTETNQGSVRIRTVVAETDSGTTRTANSVSGAFSLTGSQTTERTVWETFTNQSLDTSAYTEETVAASNARSGNSVLGTGAGTAYSTSDSTSTTSETNSTAQATVTAYGDTTVTSVDSANDVTGQFTLTETTWSVSNSTRVESNQDLSRTIESDGHSTVGGVTSGNRLSGAQIYTGYELSESTSTTTEINQSLTSTAVDIGTSDTDVRRDFNSVWGHYTLTTTAAGTETSDRTQDNQSSHARIDRDGDSTSTVTEYGNSVTGVMLRRETSDSTVTTVETSVNQSLDSTVTTEAISSGGRDRYGNSVVGSYLAVADTTIDSETWRTVENGLQLDVSHGSSLETVVDRESGNEILGSYVGGSTSNTTAGDLATGTNESRTVTTDSTSSSDRVTYRLGNRITGAATGVSDEIYDRTVYTTLTNAALLSSTTEIEAGDRVSDRTGDDLIATYAERSAGASTTTVDERSTNQSLTTTATANSARVETSSGTRNDVTGIYANQSQSDGDSTRTATETNQSAQSTLTVTSFGSDTAGRSGNSVVGGFTLASESVSTSTSRRTESNGPLSSTATETAASTSSTTETGNEILGTFTATTASQGTSTLVKDQFNQSFTIALSQSGASWGTTEADGNRILGQTTSTAVSTQSGTLSLLEINDPSETLPAITATAVELSFGYSSVVEESDGQVNSRTVTAYSENTSRRDETIYNASLTVEALKINDSTSTSTETANDIVGGYTLSDDSTSNGLILQVDRNQSLTVSVEESSTGGGSSNRDGNRIAGDFTATVESTSSRSVSTVQQNGPLWVSIGVESSSDQTVTTTGNEITGALEEDTTVDSTSHRAAFQTNQGLFVSSSAVEVSESTSNRNGNAITGDFTIESDGTTTATSYEYDVHLLTYQTFVEYSTVTTQTSGTENAISGVGTLYETVTTSSTSVDLVRNQSLETSQSVLGVNISESVKYANSVTGGFTLTSTTTGTDTTTRTVANQSLDATRTEEGASTVTTTASGNELLGARTVHDVSSRTATAYETDTNGPSTVSSTETIRETADRHTTSYAATGQADSDGSTTETVTLRQVQTNQSRSVTLTQTSTASGTSSRNGNEILGSYTLSGTNESELTLTQVETNGPLSANSYKTASETATFEASGNDITGDYTSTSDSDSSSRLVQTGTTGLRTFTLTETATGSQAVEREGSSFAGDYTATESGGSSTTLVKSDTYSDGYDSQVVVTQGSGYTIKNGNAVLGTETAAAYSSSTMRNVESGLRNAQGYSLLAIESSSGSSHSATNQVTGDYTVSAGETSNLVRRSYAYNTTSHAQYEYRTNGTSFQTSHRGGNSLTGDYTLTALASSSASHVQDSDASGYTSYILGSDSGSSTQFESGNEIEGTFTAEGSSSSSSLLRQYVDTPFGWYSLSQSQSDTATSDGFGNRVTGQSTMTTEALGTFTLYEVADEGGAEYVLTQNGTSTVTSTETSDSRNGSYTRTAEGVDTYQIVQLGTDRFSDPINLTLAGTDTWDRTETGNSQNGDFSRTLTGTGDNSVSFTQTATGNFLNGNVDRTQTGETRYDLLPEFHNPVGIDPQAPADKRLGNQDFQAVGAPFSLQGPPGSITGGGALGAGAAGGAADLALTPGSGQTGADSMGAAASLGSALLYEYCFARGTLVLLADGTSRPIEEIEPGTKVKAVSDHSPEGELVDAVVERRFDNAPAALLNVHVSGSAEPIRSTHHHPWYVRGRGWVATRDLRPGDEFRSQSGRTTRVAEVFDNGDFESVFNLQVAGARTYFVRLPGTDNGVLVHNASKKKQLPPGAEWTEFREFLDLLGIGDMFEVHHIFHEKLYELDKKGKMNPIGKALTELGFGRDVVANLIPLPNDNFVARYGDTGGMAFHNGRHTPEAVTRTADEVTKVTQDYIDGNIDKPTAAKRLQQIQDGERIVLKTTPDALHKASTVAKHIDNARMLKFVKGPGIGVVAAIAGFAMNRKAKGDGPALADAIIGSIPVVDMIQLGLESASGEDLITKDGLNTKIVSKAIANTVVKAWETIIDNQAIFIDEGRAPDGKVIMEVYAAGSRGEALITSFEVKGGKLGLVTKDAWVEDIAVSNVRVTDSRDSRGQRWLKFTTKREDGKLETMRFPIQSEDGDITCEVGLSMPQVRALVAAGRLDAADVQSKLGFNAIPKKSPPIKIPFEPVPID